MPEGEKLRKHAEREREEKFNKYNRPQGERRDKESEEEKNINLKMISGNQRLISIAGREIKSPRGLESFPRIILLSCNI